MKNNSVKFKQFVPKSSTTSVISEFSLDESPMPNAIQFQSFTHAQTISAKLNKNSVYNQQNIMFNTPRCLAVPFKEMMKDEVLSKTPVNRLQFPMSKGEPASFSEAVVKQSKYTEESLKKINRLEKFLEHQKNKNKKGNHILSSEETPKRISDPKYTQELLKGFQKSQETVESKLDPKINKKFNTLMDELRIVRKNIQYFSPFDGAYSQSRQELNNFVPLKSANGILINNGNHLTKIDLIGDTFRTEKICDSYENDSKFTSFCVCDQNIAEDMIIAGTGKGNIIGWNYFKNQAYHYYGLNNQYECNLQNSSPVFITQQLQNIYIGTTNNELLILDQRMNEKKCLSLTIQKQKSNLIRANSIQSPMLPKFGQTILESPLAKPMDANLLKETNFNLDEEKDAVIGDMEEEYPTFKLLDDLKIEDDQGIKYIDANGFNIVVTLPTGFIHIDIRNPTMEQFSYHQQEHTSLKALFSPGNPDNVIYSKQNSNKCLLWNVSKNEVLFHKELLDYPQDMIVSPETQEILFLHQQQQDSVIKIYNNSASKLKYCDELKIMNFNIQKILLDYRCESLYGVGSYSFRTWNFYSQKEIDLISEEMQHQLESCV